MNLICYNIKCKEENKIAKSKNQIQRDYEQRTGYAAQTKYLKERGKSVAMRLIHPQDDDILTKLESVPSKAGYIKKLIRADIKKESEATSTDQK